MDAAVHLRAEIERGVGYRAKETHIEINEHLIFRYFSSSGWADKFYDKEMAEAIVDTVNWRYDYGVHLIDPKPLENMIESGFIYTNGNDNYGRPILYFKVRKNSGNESMNTYLDMLMYSVEMIDRLSVDLTSGEFICILDLDQLSLKNCPPVSVMKEAITLLKRHYPYRLHAIYVVNSGIVFTTIWKLLKPFVPGRVLRKMTITTSKLDMQRTLLTQIGKENIEVAYGGEKSDQIDLDEYIFIFYCYYIIVFNIILILYSDCINGVYIFYNFLINSTFINISCTFPNQIHPNRILKRLFIHNSKYDRLILLFMLMIAITMFLNSFHLYLYRFHELIYILVTTIICQIYIQKYCVCLTESIIFYERILLIFYSILAGIISVELCTCPVLELGVVLGLDLPGPKVSTILEF